MKIMFNLSLRSGAAHAAFVRSVRRLFRSVSALPRPAFTRLGSGSDGRSVRRPFSGLPPGSGLLFRSFTARFVHGSYPRFVLSFSSSCFILLSSFPVRSVFILLSSFSVRFSFVPLSLFPSFSVLFVLSSFSCVCLPACVFYILYLAYIIHDIRGISNVFFARKHVLFKNSEDF